MTSPVVLKLELEIVGKPVELTTDNVRTFVYRLPTPIPLGTWQQFVDYLEREWHVPPPTFGPIEPPALKQIYDDITQALVLKITSFIVDVPQALFEIGFVAEFDVPRRLMPGVDIRGVGATIRFQRKSFALPADITADLATLKLPADEPLAVWQNANQVRIGDEVIDLTAVDADGTMHFTRGPSAAAHTKGQFVQVWQTKTDAITPTGTGS